MKRFAAFALYALSTTPVLAQETRQLDVHEHGVGQLDIAVEGSQIAIELHAPGADIVGFEYAAKSAEDLAAIDEAIGTLGHPLQLFALNSAASCSVIQAEAELESGKHDDHDDDDHEEHAHDDHDEDDHEEHAHDDHDEDDHEEHAHDEHDEGDHEEHAHDGHDEDDHEEHAHDERGEDDHEEHAHDEHDEHDHEEHAGHTEFHASYLLECAAPDALDSIAFPYFEVFPNALELEVQMVTDSGATSFEVTRDAPELDL